LLRPALWQAGLQEKDLSFIGYTEG